MSFGGAGSCISDTAYITAANKQAAAILRHGAAELAIQVGVALWQRNASKTIAGMQEQLADEQMRLAEEVHAHAVLFWPEETELVNDVFAEAKIEASYAGLPLIFGTMVDETLAQAREDWVDTMRTMCMAPSRCEDARWQRNAIAGEVDFVSYGARQEEARAQISNDRRFARQVAILGMGKGMTSSLISFQDVGGASALNAIGILEDGIGVALSMYGYERQLRSESTPWGRGIRDTWEVQARMPGTVGESSWTGHPLPGMTNDFQMQTRTVNSTPVIGRSWRTQ